MALDERAFFTEKPETRPGSYQCPKCRRTNEYAVRWVRRSKKDRLPPGADERDRARFAKLRDYLLRLDDVIEPIAEHEEGGMRHPLVWARELGHSRLVYDALGHDTRSYESAEHRELLTRALHWLSRVPAPTFDVT